MSEKKSSSSLVRMIKRTLVIQFFFGYIFLVTGFLVNFVQLLTALFIWPFDRCLYRKLNHHLAAIIWSHMTFFYQWWSNSEIVIFIQPEDLEKLRKENSIWLGNHRYEIDWLIGWVFSEQLGSTGGTKVLTKESLRALPIIGWCWYFTESIFLRRSWDKDRSVMQKDIRRLVDGYPSDYFFTFFLSCEGTRYSEEKRIESMKIAKEKSLAELKHHILPRTKGFSLLIKEIHGHVDAIYDMTIAFRSTERPRLKDVLLGEKFSAQAFIRRIPIENVPFDDEQKSAAFIHKLFQEKDKTFEYFVQNQTFEGAGNPRAKNLFRRKHDLLIVLICSIFIGLPSIFYLIRFLMFSSMFSKLILLLISIAGFVGVLFMIQTSRPKPSKVH